MFISMCEGRRLFKVSASLLHFSVLLNAFIINVVTCDGQACFTENLASIILG